MNKLSGSEPLLRVNGLSYSYEEGRNALDHVSVDLYQGEKIAVVGSNGAGKSTFFLCLNGVLKPDAGSIYYKNKLMGKKDLNELRKITGIVFQDADSQIVASTVFSEISFGPVNLRLSPAEVKERVHMALSYMKLENYAERAPHYLSGGEKKRVTIADIIAMEPDIFIFDEPASSLDSSGRADLQAVLLKLHKEGKTLVTATHDMDFAYQFAERILVLNNGQLLADMDPVSLFQNNEILELASLKRPAVFDLYDCMIKNGRLTDSGAWPRTVEELIKLIEKDK